MRRTWSGADLLPLKQDVADGKEQNGDGDQPGQEEPDEQQALAE